MSDLCSNPGGVKSGQIFFFYSGFPIFFVVETMFSNFFWPIIQYIN